MPFGSDPRSRCRAFHRVDDARALRRRFERIGARIKVDVRRFGVPDPELERARRRRCQHAADTGPKRPHAKIPLTQIARLIAFHRAQRATQRVAEHEDRQSHRAAIAGDELARDEVGVEIEIAHAGGGLSNPDLGGSAY